MKTWLLQLVCIFAIALIAASCSTTRSCYQETLPWEPNYDEAAMPSFRLPKVLTCEDGQVVRTAEEWQSHRRPELLQLFEETMYGKPLPLPDAVEYQLLSEKADEFDGLAIRREIQMTFRMADGRSHDLVVLMYVPAHQSSPVPLFAGLTFTGNHAIVEDPAVQVTGLRYPKTQEAREKWSARRGKLASSYPIRTIIERGYACAFASYNDIFPDRADGWSNSVYRLWFDEDALATRLPDYTSIGAWAWGFSRVIDCALQWPEVDASRIACIGHSRLGKSALWAGAQDERIGLVCVNDSGCGGAALSRRRFGETLFSMCHHNSFGKFWFVESLAERSLHPENLPIDQHELVALVAPRAIAVHSATEDQWADPKGEYLGAYHAGPVYRLFGIEGLSSPTPPPPDTPVGQTVSYLLRTGKHALQAEDWAHYLDVADRAFGTGD